FNHLARVLHMPEAYENERKFLVLNFDPALIPSEAVRVVITQDYLRNNRIGFARRVRKREIDGKAAYYYTEKAPTSIAGRNIERERIISFSEYERLLAE